MRLQTSPRPLSCLVRSYQSSIRIRSYYAAPPPPPLLQLVLHWEQYTICRGGQSLLERLTQRFPTTDLSRYIEFFALRKHALLGDRAVSEQVYVHSKVLIADDRAVSELM